MQAKNLKLLSKLELFKEFSNTELMLVLMSARTLAYEPDQIIIQEGTEGDALYIVKGGVVRITKYDGRGREHELATIGSGECFGEVSLLDTEPRSASVYAKTACVLFRVGRHEFADLMAHHKEIERKFYKAVALILAKRLRHANEYLTFNLEVGELISEIRKEKK